jgi:hypothetical protein
MPMPPISLPARAHGPVSRAVVGGLRGIAFASMPALLGLVVYATDPPITPPVLFRLLVVWTIAPATLASLIERVLTTTLTVDAATLAIARRDVRIEAPLQAIAGVVPWAVPLPEPGVWLRMRSGRRLAYGVAADDPTALLDALAGAGVDVPREHPAVVWAHARSATPSWLHRIGKFVVFGALPAGVLFNAHQHIAYGGTFGQWYLLGPGAWFTTLAVYWATVVAYLVMWAATWRWLGELVALAAAAVAPSRAARVRRTVELVCGAAYWLGVPLLLALRFAP